MEYLTNKQVQEGLDYCYDRVQDGKVWVCLLWEDWGRDCLNRGFPGTSDCMELEKKIQEYLQRKYIEIHGCPSNHKELDVEDTLAGPHHHWEQVSPQGCKQFRLEMIRWLREQYPV